MDDIDLGRCCACRRADRSASHIVMLDVKAPEPGTGWGCLVCDLAMDGAYAVLCWNCLEGGVEPAEAVAGYLGDGRRAPIAQCTGAHSHDMSKHDGDDDPGDGRFDLLGEDGGDDDCGLLPDGTCQLAGTEHCDWDCPYSK